MWPRSSVSCLSEIIAHLMTVVVFTGVLFMNCAIDLAVRRRAAADRIIELLDQRPTVTARPNPSRWVAPAGSCDNSSPARQSE
jgi:hypothetical protein